MDTETKPASAPSPKEALAPIPIPARIRWLEFRARVLPLMAFCAALVAIWLLWQDLPTGGIRGIGDGTVSVITSPQDGFLQKESVEPFGWVEAGQPLVSIAPYDPAGGLDLFQSRLQVARLGLEPTISERTALDYEKLRVDALRLKQELAMGKANLELATKVLPRHEALLKEKLISQDIYDATVRDRDFYKAEVEEKSKAIGEIDKRLEALRTMSDPEAQAGTSALARLMPQLEEQLASLQTNWNPVLVHAPVSGEVQFYRRAGGFVRAGEPILVISGPRADRVIAYLKQPFPFEPTNGMPMEVITRSTKPQRFLTQIARVGARVEILTNAIAYLQTGALVDSGLPLILPVPPGAQVRPGEVVDVLPYQSVTNQSLISKWLGATPRTP